MSRRRTSKLAHLTPEKVISRHLRNISNAAALAGVPESQRTEGSLELQLVPQIGQEATPIRHTVRKLTRIEKLQRAGVLEPHEAAACSWYADRHSLGFDTVVCTANYEGGSGGGGFNVLDLLARSKAQMHAREDYAWAKTFIPKPYVALFEAIVIHQEPISGVARAAFALGRSQAENKTRIALKFCANLLHQGIGSLLPFDVPPAPVKRAAPAPAAAEPAAPAAVRQKPVTDDLNRLLDDAMLGGRDTAQIHIAKLTLQALKQEGDHDENFRGFPLIEREGWGWGYTLVPPPAEAAILSEGGDNER